MRLIFILIFLLSFSSCRKHEVPKSYIARVGDSYLTNEDVEEYLKHSKDTSDLQFKIFLKKWIDNELLFLEATKKNIDKSAKVTKQLEDVKKQLTISEYLENEIYSKNISIGDEDINNYYFEHKDEFVLREDAVMLNIVSFSDRKAASDFRTYLLKSEDWNNSIDLFLADTVFNKLIVSASFAQLYTQLTLFHVDLWKIANNLQQNEVSFPVKIDNLFYIVQFLEKYPKNSIAPINFVKDEIKNRLTIDKRKRVYDELVNSLLKKHKVEIKINE